MRLCVHTHRLVKGAEHFMAGRERASLAASDSKATVHRRRMPMRWTVREPQHSVADLCTGTGTFVLVTRDYKALREIFRRNFAATRHLRMFSSPRAASNRLRRLLEEGLVARTAVTSVKNGAVRGWEYAYGLTSLGLECLAAGGDRDAASRLGEWQPPYLTGTSRNNVLHELSVADLCSGLVEHLETERIVAGWMSSRDTFQQVHSMMAGGQRLIVAPDAAVVLSTGDSILVEYEESLRPESFGRKLVNYARYFQGRVWSAEYVRAPKVLFSLSGESDRQRYWTNPLEQGLQMAKQVVALYPYVYLIREQNWRNGLWSVLPIRDGDVEEPLHQVVIRQAADADGA